MTFKANFESFNVYQGTHLFGMIGGHGLVKNTISNFDLLTFNISVYIFSLYTCITS